jgi:hypothetical protein
MPSLNSFYDKTNESDFKVSFDRSKNLKDQLIYAEDNFYLLNVSKTYVNNNYIGVTFFYIKNSKNIQKTFRDVARFPEDLVNNREKLLINKRFKKLVKDKYEDIKNTVHSYSVPFTLTLDEEIIKGEKVYTDNVYAFSNLYFDNNIICRGVYGFGFKKKFYKQNKILEPTENDLIKYAKEMKYTALQNVYTYVKTEYSKIEIINKE